MCGNCYCEPRGQYGHHMHEHHMGFPWPIMDVEEEIKALEEYKEVLTQRLEKVNKRLETPKR